MVNIQNKFIPSRIISKILFTALLFFFISCLCLSCLFADTNVGGEITQDTTWTFAPNPPYNNGSPYIVIDTVTVNQGVTLTIEPGVQVKFAGNRSLIINGSLVAQGTQIQPITFTSNRPNPAPRDWQSIFFADTSDDTTCIVSYAIIEYATTSIYITNASPRIEYNTVRNNPNGITADNSSSPTITNNTIENNTYGIYCQDSSSPAITNNTLQNNTYGIYCQYSSSSAITNNTIINNEYGIYTSGSLTNYPNPFINNNSIYNNTQYNLYAYASNNCSSLTINAQNNWWGTVDVITITQKIYDYTDNPNSPAVDFIPFLDGPNGSPIEGNFVLGSINQNTTWTQAQSPYIVVGSINVLQAITLTIEPGVQIKFAGSFSLTVNGSLIAQGNQTNPITFSSSRQTPAIGDWQGIQFTDSSDDLTCIISYAIIEYSSNGINTNNASPRIENNTIRNNQNGIYCEYYSLPAITNNTIINNAYGIYTSGSLTNYPNPTINNNSIYNNSSYNLYTYATNNCSSLTINAQNNWWGTVDVITITQKIYDYTDNPNFPAVDFIPFLDGPNGNPIEGNFVLGPINQNTTWTQAQSPYIVVGSINVLQAITLTIEPGVQIKFAGSFSLTVNGSLIAQGTQTNPITFTSNRQTPAIGDWQQINFTDTSDDVTCIISYAIIEYSDQGIHTYRASPRIEQNTLQNNNRGIYCENSSSSAITNNTIINNAYGIYTSGSLFNYPNPTINNNSIYNNIQYNLYAYASNNCSSLTINAQNNWWGTIDPVVILQTIYDNLDNSYSPVVDFMPFLDGPNGNPIEGTLVYGPINTNTTWTLVNSPYIVVGNITINQNRTLTIQPGVQVKFAGNFSLIVWGSLIASGTESQPITFTSNRQTPAIGDWQYILFTNISNDATCIISYAVVEYSNQGIYAQNASPRIEHNTLQNNNRGIYCEYRSSLTIIITNNTIINNAYGIYTSGSLTNYPNPFINNNSIYNNTQYNLYAYASNNCSSLTINAEYNWWGTMDSVLIRQSIYDHADNPNSPVVDFIPYLDGPNGNPVFQITNVSVNPHSFNPSNNERVNINYTLDRNADVTITIQNLSYNAIRTIGPNPKLAGANSDVWDGRNAAGEIVADNAYTFTIEAIAGTIFGEYTPEYIPNPVGVTGFTVDTDFNPHNNELCRIDYNLADYAEVLIRVGEAGGGGANWPIIDWRPRIPGLNTDYWNGRDPNGRIVNLNTVTFAIWTRALPDEPIIVVSDFTVSVSTDPYSIIPSYREFTTITYNISQTANVTVSVYDIDGALVKVLEDNAPKPAGTYVLTWDGTNSQGRVVPQEGNFTVMVEARSGSGRLATAFGNVTVH